MTYETPTAVCTSRRTGSILATSSPSTSWLSPAAATSFACLPVSRRARAACALQRALRVHFSLLSVEKCTRKAFSTEMPPGKPG